MSSSSSSAAEETDTSSKARPKRNKKPKADDVVRSCEDTVTKAAAASRLRFGPASEGRELVIYHPHPGLHSLYYKAAKQTLLGFITESLKGNELLQLDSARRAIRVNAVFKNIITCPTDAFPRIEFNDDMCCYTNGVLLLSSMKFYAYDGNINELDVGKAARDASWRKLTTQAQTHRVSGWNFTCQEQLCKLRRLRLQRLR